MISSDNKFKSNIEVDNLESILQDYPVKNIQGIDLIKNSLAELDKILINSREEYQRCLSEQKKFDSLYTERITNLEHEVNYHEHLVLTRKLENKWLYLRNQENRALDVLIDIELLQSRILGIDTKMQEVILFSDEFMQLKRERKKLVVNLNCLDDKLNEIGKKGRIYFNNLEKDVDFQLLNDEYLSATGQHFPNGAELFSEVSEDEFNDELDEDIFDYLDDEDDEEEEEEEEEDDDDDDDDGFVDIEQLRSNIEADKKELLSIDYDMEFLWLDDHYEDIALEKEFNNELIDDSEDEITEECKQLQKEIREIVMQRITNIVKECIDWCSRKDTSTTVTSDTYELIKMINEAYSQFNLNKLIELLTKMKGMKQYSLLGAYEANVFDEQ